MSASPAAVPTSVYLLRRNTQVVGYSDKGRMYLIGFMQQTHAHLVKRHITATPMLRLERQDAVTMDMDAKLSIVKVDDDGIAGAFDWDVAPVAYEKFMRVPLTSKTGILIPYAYMDEEEDEGTFTFRCQVCDTSLP